MTAEDRLVKDYLRQLRKTARVLPRARRQELLADIEEHIAAARSGGTGEVYLRNVLDALGDPDDIVAGALEPTAPTGRRFRDVTAIVLLVVGGVIVPVLGWLVGVVLLWSSSSWTTGRKLLGTLLWPGGLGLAFLLLALPAGSGSSCDKTLSTNLATGHTTTSTVCKGGSGGSLPEWAAVLLLAVLVIGPLLVAVDLYRHARPAQPAAPNRHDYESAGWRT